MSRAAELERRARILVVEDDDDQRDYLLRVLGRLGELEPVGAPDPAAALRLLEEENWDLLITDLMLPGMNGLALADEAQELRAGIPVIVVTAHPSLESAVEAVRAGVSDFLVKPLEADSLLTAVDRALAGFHRVTARVLAIGAHPDDVELGCGGTLALHRIHGDEVTILVLSGGADVPDRDACLARAERSAARLGAQLVVKDLPDTLIAESAETDALIAQVIADLRPDSVYTHSQNDVVTDHRAVHASVRRVARAIPRVLCFQSPSCSVDFRPTEFVGIDNTLETKLAALAAFQEVFPDRDYLSVEMIRASARYWGRFATARFAEPFEVVRDRIERPIDRLEVPVGRSVRAGRPTG